MLLCQLARTRANYIVGDEAIYRVALILALNVRLLSRFLTSFIYIFSKV